MGVVAANSNRFFNRYEGISPALTFAGRINPLCALFGKTFKLENANIELNHQFMRGYDLVEKRDYPIFNQRTLTKTLFLTMYKVARFTLAILATATIVLPLAGLLIQAFYAQKTGRIQQLIREMHNENDAPNVRGLNFEERLGQVRAHQNQIRREANLPNLLQDEINEVNIRQFIDRQFVDDILHMAQPLVVRAAGPRQDLEPQCARFAEFAFMRRAVSQEQIMSPEERTLRLTNMSVNPTIMKDIIKCIERDARQRQQAPNADQRGALAHAEQDLTAEDFAKLRFNIDVAHYYGSQRGVFERRGNFTTQNYALDGAAPIMLGAVNLPTMHQNDETIRKIYEDLRVLMSFFAPNAENNLARQNGEEPRVLTLEYKLLCMKRLSDAFNTCTPTWSREVLNVLRFISNPGVNIDSVESLKEDIAKEFHDDVTQSVESTNASVLGSAHTLAKFIERNGDTFGYSQEEIARASLDPYRSDRLNDQILERFRQIFYPNRIVNDRLEKLNASAYKGYIAQILTEAAENLAARRLRGENNELPDAALAFHEDRDGMGMALWVDSFYNPRIGQAEIRQEAEQPFNIPKYLVIEIYRNLEVFA